MPHRQTFHAHGLCEKCKNSICLGWHRARANARHMLDVGPLFANLLALKHIPETVPNGWAHVKRCSRSGPDHLRSTSCSNICPLPLRVLEDPPQMHVLRQSSAIRPR